MKKRIFLVTLALVAILAAWVAWAIFGPSTAFRGTKYNLYIRTGMRFDQLQDSLAADTVLLHPGLFRWIASKMDYPQNMRAGKYEIRRGMSLISILRMIKNGRQTPVNLVVIKLRTREDLASLVGRKLECDSLAFLQWLSNPDSLKEFNLDSNTVMTAVFPDTYTYFWNSSPGRIFRKLFAAHKSFWTDQRIRQARTLGLTPAKAYILASIVEEETGKKEDKGKIADWTFPWVCGNCTEPKYKTLVN